MSKIKIYNLRIVPPNPVFEEVVHFKEQFREAFGKQPLSKSKPHITLAIFRMDLQYQDILVKVFNQLSSIPKFKLGLNGFGSFENGSNVLLLKVPKTGDMERLHTQIRIIWARDLHCKQGSLKISNPPHMTISKTEGREMLYESLSLFQEMDYYRQIEINYLALVSRYEGRTWDWEHKIHLSTDT